MKVGRRAVGMIRAGLI